MTKIPSEIFREYDIRGDAERDLTDENVLAIARAYGFRRSGSALRSSPDCATAA